jgi:3-methylfumaryl-CoA hydratase
MDTHAAQFSNWIGSTQSHREVLTLAPALALVATLDKRGVAIAEGFELPALWHWLYFLKPVAGADLATDGHAAKGGFLPPIELPRRMWAGSRFDFHQALHVGEQVEKTSTIKSVDIKQGRSGQLAFVCIEHKYTGDNGLALREEHDIVYRENPSTKASPAAPVAVTERADFRKSVTPDPVLLFRYSALTFNGHRIHYDRDYVTNTEGYPGLIVHGPLLATLLVELLMENVPGYCLTKFKFRALHPVFDLKQFEVCGCLPDAEGHCNLWIQNHAAALCMTATATLLSN